MKTLKFKLNEDLELNELLRLKKNAIIEIPENEFWGAAVESPVNINGVEYWIKTKYLIPVTENKFLNFIYDKANLILSILMAAAFIVFFAMAAFYGITILYIFAFSFVFVGLHFLGNHIRENKKTETKPEGAPFDLFGNLENEQQKQVSKFRPIWLKAKPILSALSLRLFFKLSDVFILWLFLKLFGLI